MAHDINMTLMITSCYKKMDGCDNYYIDENADDNSDVISLFFVMN